MQIITFTAIGIPAPGGSKKAFVLRRRDGSIVTRPNGSPVVNIVDDARRNKDWRAVVSAAAANAIGAPLTGPLSVAVVFTMPRPKNHYGTGRNAGVLKPNAPKYHTTKPDATKLWRSTEDALRGIVWRDDSQVAEQVIMKVYGDRPGARVQITELGEKAQPRAEAATPLFAGVS